MQETKFYQQVLGLSAPWRVVSVKLDIPVGQVQFQLEHDSGARWKCLGRELACYDLSGERTWRRLDVCRLQALLVARLPGLSVRSTESNRSVRSEPSRMALNTNGSECICCKASSQIKVKCIVN